MSAPRTGPRWHCWAEPKDSISAQVFGDRLSVRTDSDGAGVAIVLDIEQALDFAEHLIALAAEARERQRKRGT
jgi:hypothetical protein